MTLFDVATSSALASGAHKRRSMLYIRGKTALGVAANFGFWSGAGNITTNVTSAFDGATESRSYIGDGSIINIDQIMFSLGLEVGSLSVKMNHLHSSVSNMIRGNDIRNAVAEIHIAIFDKSTGALVYSPTPFWLGYVDGAPITTGQAGGSGDATIKLVGCNIDLARVNYLLKSDETQKQRSGDRFRKWADSAGGIKIWWGEAR
jgi:hypothetical protein